MKIIHVHLDAPKLMLDFLIFNKNFITYNYLKFPIWQFSKNYLKFKILEIKNSAFANKTAFLNFKVKFKFKVTKNGKGYEKENQKEGYEKGY